MKQLVYLLVSAVLFSACQGNTSERGSTKMSLGGPPATVTAQPNNLKQKGPLAYGAQVPPLQEGDTVEVKIDVTHRLYEIARGVQFTAWLFGDSLPGPTLHLRVGQTVKFSMTDRSNDSMAKKGMNINMMPMPHSIDFHAAMVNPADKYRSINPGETISYTWTANYPGVFMYHCGTPMVLLHMISGMIGMAIVEPKGGYPGKADREFALLQNEYYVKQNGAVYGPDTVSAMRQEPKYVAFNGKVGQYVVHPLKAKAGERIRVYFLNAGANNISSFHVIGTILDKVWLDGNPKNELVGMQAVTVGPAQGAILEFVLPEKGRYTFVDHSFANAEKGAIGVFQAE